MKSRFEPFARAAMVGLIAAAGACQAETDDAERSDEDGPLTTSGDGDEASSGDGDMSGDGDTSGDGDSSGDGDQSLGGAGADCVVSEGGFSLTPHNGSGGALPDGVVAMEIVPDLPLDEFTDMCGKSCGIVEIHEICGNVVSGPGWSWDDDTFELTEHTCATINTCAGYSCVIDDEP